MTDIITRCLCAFWIIIISCILISGKAANKNETILCVRLLRCFMHNNCASFEGKRKHFVRILFRKMKNAAAANCREITAGVTSSFSTYRRVLLFSSHCQRDALKTTWSSFSVVSQEDHNDRGQHVNQTFLKTKLEKKMCATRPAASCLSVWVLSAQCLFLMTVLRVGSFPESFFRLFSLFQRISPPTHTHTFSNISATLSRPSGFLPPTAARAPKPEDDDLIKGSKNSKKQT